MQIRKTQSSALIIILIALAISPAFALGDGNRNLLLIAIMCLSPIIILSYGRYDRINPWLVLFMASIIIIPVIHQPQSMRWSTVLYSAMFCLTFMAYNELLYSSYFTPYNYLKILNYLILAYFVVLVIQQFCVLTGITIFNVSGYYPVEPWKLNSLAAEPSHSARIVALLMYCYITVKELVACRKYNFKFDINKDKWLWVAFIWTMLTMGSGTAFLFIFILLLKFLRFKKLLPFFIIGLTLFFLIDNFEFKSFDRAKNVFLATLTLDEKAILHADHSAAMRIVPIVVVAKTITINSLDSWFGHGIDFTSSFLSERIPGLPEGTSGGGMFQIWLEYGFISFALFIIFSLSASYRKGDYLSVLFWFLLVFIYGINNQIVWLSIVLLFTNRYFFKSENSRSFFNRKPIINTN